MRGSRCVCVFPYTINMIRNTHFFCGFCQASRLRFHMRPSLMLLHPKGLLRAQCRNKSILSAGQMEFVSCTNVCMYNRSVIWTRMIVSHHPVVSSGPWQNVFRTQRGSRCRWVQSCEIFSDNNCCNSPSILPKQSFQFTVLSALCLHNSFCLWLVDTCPS